MYDRIGVGITNDCTSCNITESLLLTWCQLNCLKRQAEVCEGLEDVTQEVHDLHVVVVAQVLQDVLRPADHGGRRCWTALRADLVFQVRDEHLEACAQDLKQTQAHLISS